ncbi:MAG: UDP-N-acetylbacillosamine N-acetyltransferase [Campylobacter sp.]|uniref:UDP-N-acetylbacillosamine N-acetyltransferase n=1 Tax=Campylobacter concisus TaxID=199 RepID=UPI000D3187FB|nr:UDP-N-acetylbacillosamine N-acetyltransferase [Campylobacter concisus]MDO4875396.1 UDP-N-acetylbacillosamine N-acetyltransferase [Campylobacter sp.]
MAKTKKIYIYGASGHGLVVADIARNNGYDEIVFLDDASEFKFSPKLEKADIIIAIGENKTRQKISQRVEAAGFEIVTLIHKSAVVSESAVIEKGAVIMPNAVINAKVRIKEGAIINSGAVIEHECVIDKFAHISPNVALAGNVSVGEFTHIGIGSSIIQDISIGKNCIIGAGSVVVRDIKDGTKAYGVPACERAKI